MKETTVQELKRMIDDKVDFQLIDVREIYEYEAANINGMHIPMGEVFARAGEISKDKPVIVHCRSGARSATVIKQLESKMGFTNLNNLKGGIMAWAAEIDPSLQVG